MLSGMLSLYFFFLYVDEVLRCSLPLRIQDESLVVFGLGEDACPRLQESRCVVNGFGYSLYEIRIYFYQDKAPSIHTSMLFFAFCRLSTTPSMTLFTLRTLSNSLRSAASRASSVE